VSARLIALSPDLSHLREEGYELDVRDGYVVVANVPYVTSDRQVARGSLVVALTTSGERTGAPPDHTVMWTGSMPCHQDGSPISRIDAGGGGQIAPDLVANHRFSSKPMPACRYEDYYAQFTAYIRILSHEAQALDSTATATTFAPVETTEEESVFRYLDSASSRAGIRMANAKLELEKLAIVGLGGTGSYLLDLVAKTPVGEIHLFDGDILLNHNAFRAPGAVPLEDLKRKPLKVNYYAALYDNLHRNVIPHPYRLDEHNATELDNMAFVFLCMDGGPDKRAIVERLETAGVAFIDTGMGLDEHNASIGGIVRVTASTPEQRRPARQHISFDDPDDGANEYARNIQVADLNALNACLAVLRWKRRFGFYRDLEHEHNTLFTIDGNHLLNEDRA
jgi:ThiF family